MLRDPSIPLLVPFWHVAPSILSSDEICSISLDLRKERATDSVLSVPEASSSSHAGKFVLCCPFAQRSPVWVHALVLQAYMIHTGEQDELVSTQRSGWLPAGSRSASVSRTATCSIRKQRRHYPRPAIADGRRSARNFCSSISISSNTITNCGNEPVAKPRTRRTARSNHASSSTATDSCLSAQHVQTWCTCCCSPESVLRQAQPCK